MDKGRKQGQKREVNVNSKNKMKTTIGTIKKIVTERLGQIQEKAQIRVYDRFVTPWIPEHLRKKKLKYETGMETRRNGIVSGYWWKK